MTKWPTGIGTAVCAFQIGAFYVFFTGRWFIDDCPCSKKKKNIFIFYSFLLESKGAISMCLHFETGTSGQSERGAEEKRWLKLVMTRKSGGAQTGTEPAALTTDGVRMGIWRDRVGKGECGRAPRRTSGSAPNRTGSTEHQKDTHIRRSLRRRPWRKKGWRESEFSGCVLRLQKWINWKPVRTFGGKRLSGRLDS